MEDNSNNTNSMSTINTNSTNTNLSGNKVNNRCNLIVNYLPQSLKEHDFNNLFSKIGPLKSCKLMYDRQTGYSFGYGFVEYVNEQDAIKAIETLNGYQIEHKRLKVALARPNCEDTKNTNLYIRNIPVTFDEQSLHNLFSQYGEVVQVRLLRDQNTAFTRRIGFVIMGTKQMAQLAIQHLDNTIPQNGGPEPIYVKYADEEGKKRHPPNSNQSNIRMSNNPNFNQNTNNYLTQSMAAQQSFNFNQANSFIQSGLNPFNLGKMKTNRSAGHQNRFNPLSGTAIQPPNQQATLSAGSAQPANSYNPWNMPPAYTNLSQATSSNQTNMIGNTGFENILNTIGGGGSGGGGANLIGGSTNVGANQSSTNYLNYNHPMQQQQHYSSNPNSYLSSAASIQFAVVAAAALANNNNTTNNNNLIDPNQQMDNKGATLSSTNMNGHIIYVYGIGQANESDLYSLFSNCGRILRVNVIKNQKTGQCKGYGFVVFEAYEEAYCAVHTMNGFVYNNRPLQVSFKSFQNTTTGNSSGSTVPTGSRLNNENSSMRMLETYNSNLTSIDTSSGQNEMNSFY